MKPFLTLGFHPRLIILLLLVVALVACQASPPTITPIPATATPIPPTATATVTPTATATATPTATPTITPSPTASATPRPTATPTVLTVSRLTFNHPATVMPTAAIRDRIVPWQFPLDASDEASLTQLIAISRASPPQITRAQAEEDTRTFFSLLKHGYAGYGAFGASGEFAHAENTILQTLAREQTITPARLAETIRASITFVNDCHLSVGGQSLFQDPGYFYYDRINFFKEGDRFYFFGAGGKTFVETVNGRPPHEYMKLALSSEGDPVYHLGTVAAKYPGALSLDTLTANGKRARVDATWDRSSRVSDRQVFRRYLEGEVTIVSIRSFSDDPDALRKFHQDAENLRIEALVVVDLRGNSGGLISIPAQWITGLTWRTPAFPFIRTEIESRTAIAGKINLNAGRDLNAAQVQTLLRDWENGKRQPRWSNILVPELVPFRWHQLMVVLMDNQTASAGEVMLGYLRQFEHVVFIGENSAGCITYGDVSSYTLPHSNLPIRFGSELFITPDLTHFEGKGFAPDLWMPSNKALPAALAAIKRGWLKSPP